MNAITHKSLYCRNLNTAYLEGLPTVSPRGIYIFIHGCPDDATIWENLMKRFQNEGFIVLAPFLRGIEKSEAPVDKNTYRYTPESVTLDHLEILALYDENLPVTVVCHDLGSISGWELARKLGKRLARLVAINAPDSMTLIKQFRKTSQIKKSWYIGVLQTGRVAELIFSRFKRPIIKSTLMKGKYPSIDEEKIQKSIEHFPKFIPHYQEAIIDLSKRLVRNVGSRLQLTEAETKISSPMILWGIKDPFLNIPTVKDLNSVALGPEIRVLDGGHWLPIEKEDDVFRLMMKKSSL